MIGKSRHAVRLVVSCPCGTSTPVEAGASLTCGCGRSWDTGRLPADDVDAVGRLVRRARSRRLVFVLNLLAVTAVLVLLARAAPALAVLLGAFVWWRFCRPEWRRRRETTRTDGLPAWQLRSSGGASSPGAEP